MNGVWAMSETRVLVGVVGAAQGVRGEMRIKSFTAEPRDIGRYGPLATEAGRSLTILSLRALKGDMLVARIAGVDDREAAAGLTHMRLFVPRDRLPPPAPDEVYHVDLIGLRAEDEDGTVLGRVRAVENHGAGDILEIDPEAAGDTLLVPFTPGFVPVVDIAAGRLVVARGALIPEAEGDAAIEGG